MIGYFLSFALLSLGTAYMMGGNGLGAAVLIGVAIFCCIANMYADKKGREQ